MKAFVGVLVAMCACGIPERAVPDAGDPPPEKHATLLTPNAPGATVAMRRPDGAWTLTSGYHSPIDLIVVDGEYTVMIGCHSSKRVDVYTATVDELPVLTWDAGCVVAPQLATATGDVSGFDATNGGFLVSWGPWVGDAPRLGGPGRYELLVQAGTHDLIAGRELSHFGAQADQLVIQRDVTFADGAVANLDVSAATALPILWVATLPTPDTVGTFLSTANGTIQQLGENRDGYRTIPESMLAPGDLLRTRETLLDDSFVHVGRRVPSEIDLPGGVGPAAHEIMIREDPFIRFAVDWSETPGAIAYQLRAGYWTVNKSAASFLRDPHLEMPDMTKVQSWPAILGFTPYGSAFWGVLAFKAPALDDVWRDHVDHETTITGTGTHGEDQLSRPSMTRAGGSPPSSVWRTTGAASRICTTERMATPASPGAPSARQIATPAAVCRADPSATAPPCRTRITVEQSDNCIEPHGSCDDSPPQETTAQPCEMVSGDGSRNARERTLFSRQRRNPNAAFHIP